VTVIFYPTDYNPKIAAAMGDQAYENLNKDSTEAVEQKAVLLKDILTFLTGLQTTPAPGFIYYLILLGLLFNREDGGGVSELHCVTTNKTLLFIVTGMRILNASL
jgi:hypothetical protein